MTDIRWQAFGIEEPFTPITPFEQQAILDDWYDEGHAEAAVNQICERYFSADDAHWTERFGDDLSCEILVVVRLPQSLAGAYNVEIERVIRARAAPIQDPRA